jgi:tetratricopeptide (TPR) repeat protein
MKAVEREAQAASQVANYITHLLTEASPRGSNVTGREILDLGASRILEGFADNPLLRASLAGNFGVALRFLGSYAKAESLLLEARAGYVRTLGERHASTAGIEYHLGVLAFDMGRLEEAERWFLRALEVREEVRGRNSYEVGSTLGSLAAVYREAGQPDRAKANYREAIAVLEAVFGKDDYGITAAVTGLGNLHRDLGEFEEARRLYERSFRIIESSGTGTAWGVSDWPLGTTVRNLAQVHRYLGNHDVALSLYERVLAIEEKELDPDHPDRARTAMHMALMMVALGRSAEAESWVPRADAIYEKQDHPIGRILYLKARYHALKGEREPALVFLHQALGAGFGLHRMARDPDLASLRGTPEFEALLKEPLVQAARFREAEEGVGE